MLDNEFLEFLEYVICKAYLQAGYRDTKLWCRSVSLSPSEGQYLQESVKQGRQMALKAAVGKFANTEYDLHLNFGEVSSALLIKDLDIKRCVPNPKNQDLLAIDFEKKCISIVLS